MDVAFMIDLSGSVVEVHQIAIEMAREISWGLDMSFERTRISAVAFADGVVDKFYLNQYTDREQVQNALTYYNKGGRTNLPLALDTAMNDLLIQPNGERPGVPNVAILISDGYATVEEWRVNGLVQQLKDRGIELFTIGMGPNPNPELPDWASPTSSEHYYYVPDLSQVQRVAGDILNILCR